MVIGLLILEFQLPGIQSLKEKRRVLKSFIERVKARHNVSVAELDKQDVWRQAVVGVTMISSAQIIVDRTFAEIIRMAESQGEAVLVYISLEML